MTLLDQIIEPYGYTTTDAGWFGFCMLAASLPMIFLAGYIIDKTKYVIFQCTSILTIYFLFSIQILQPECKGKRCPTNSILFASHSLF